MTDKERQFLVLVGQLHPGYHGALTVSSVARALGIHRDTAQRYLSKYTGMGLLIADTVQYRSHIKQTCYYVNEEFGKE